MPDFFDLAQVLAHHAEVLASAGEGASQAMRRAAMAYRERRPDLADAAFRAHAEAITGEVVAMSTELATLHRMWMRVAQTVPEQSSSGHSSETEVQMEPHAQGARYGTSTTHSQTEEEKQDGKG